MGGLAVETVGLKVTWRLALGVMGVGRGEEGCCGRRGDASEEGPEVAMGEEDEASGALCQGVDVEDAAREGSVKGFDGDTARGCSHSSCQAVDRCVAASFLAHVKSFPRTQMHAIMVV